MDVFVSSGRNTLLCQVGSEVITPGCNQVCIEALKGKNPAIDIIATVKNQEIGK